MARRRRTIKRRTPRRNPSPSRRRTAITRRAKAAFSGLNFRSALKDVPIQTLGMFAAKWAAKRWGEAATEDDRESWNYASYLKGAAGAAVAGYIANMVKPGSGQKVLNGGLSLMAFKLVENELVPKSEWAMNQFGAAQTYSPGDVETNSAGEPFILGEDYQWVPMQGADDYRMMGQTLQPVGRLGSTLEPVGRLGDDNQVRYQNAFLRR